MVANADITIYNRHHDREKGYDVYRQTVIRSVWFFVDNRVQITESGVAAASIYKVRIPVSSVTPESIFVLPHEYTGAEHTWTLQADDYICRGIRDQNIGKPAELKKESGQVFKITSWSDNRFGSLKHFRIGGV